VRWFKKKDNASPQEKKEQKSAINAIRKGKEVVKFMSEWIGSEYQPMESTIPFIDGKFKGLMDKEKISMLIPSLYTFNFTDFQEISLDSLDFGFNEEGVAVVGLLHCCKEKVH